MYIAINIKNPLEAHSFEWTEKNELIINGKVEKEEDWQIVEVKILTADNQ